MAYKVIILYQLYMPSYFLGTFTEYPYLKIQKSQLIHNVLNMNQLASFMLLLNVPLSVIFSLSVFREYGGCK